MEMLLTLENLRFRRDDFTLEVDRLDLQPGQIYLLQGANGAGKSTLLQLMALLLLPERGELRFNGQPVTGAAERQRLRRQITLVEQSPYLFDTTVYQNLAFGLRLRDVRGDLQQRRINQALAAVGLQGYEARHARLLSGGETRRVALARALVLQPRLLLLDEPTAGLDREILPVFERCLAELPGRNTTVVLAGHDGDQPRRLGATPLVLDRGRLLAPDPAAEPLLKENA